MLLGGGDDPFSSPRQDLPSVPFKSGRSDCLTGIRPILKSGFAAISHRRIPMSGAVAEFPGSPQAASRFRDALDAAAIASNA
jgi:hypothetical protein